MKKGLIITGILGGLGLFSYAIYSFYKKQFDLLKNFQANFIGFTVSDFTLQLVKGTITFRFQSTSDIEVTITKFYMDFYFNGQKVGYVQDTVPVVIPANGYNDIPFEFTLDPQFIFQNATDIIAYATQQKDALITLDGNVSVKSGFVSATVPIKCNCSLMTLDCNC